MWSVKRVVRIYNRKHVVFPTCDSMGRSVSYPSGTGSSGIDFSLVLVKAEDISGGLCAVGLVDGRTLKDDCAKMLF